MYLVRTFLKKYINKLTILEIVLKMDDIWMIQGLMDLDLRCKFLFSLRFLQTGFFDYFSCILFLSLQ
jgi:hypothetical protein